MSWVVLSVVPITKRVLENSLRNIKFHDFIRIFGVACIHCNVTGFYIIRYFVTVYKNNIMYARTENIHSSSVNWVNGDVVSLLGGVCVVIKHRSVDSVIRVGTYICYACV